MAYFKPNPRRVKLHHDTLSSPLQFDSCKDAIYFLWNDVRKRSIKIETVANAFHSKDGNYKPIYGYRIEKEENCIPDSDPRIQRPLWYYKKFRQPLIKG